jgi:heme/copper-type cytochrome/quinol oxidase subunit 1
MRWIDRLNMAQRVVVVITVGLALGIVASYLTGLGVRTGWYAYAPLSGQLVRPPGGDRPPFGYAVGGCAGRRRERFA